MSSYKEVNISNPGTVSQVGADDYDFIAKLLNGQVSGLPPVIIRSSGKFGFADNVLFIEDSDASHGYRIRSEDLTQWVDLFLPAVTQSIAHLIIDGAENIFSAKQIFDKQLQIKRGSEPPDPPTGYLALWADDVGEIKVKDEFGNLLTIMADVSGALNVGSGAGIFQEKNNGTLEFQTIVSDHDALTLDNTTDPDEFHFDIDESELDLQLIGGTLQNTQMAQILDKNKQHGKTMYEDSTNTITAIHTFNEVFRVKNQTQNPGNAPAGHLIVWADDDDDSFKYNDDQGNTRTVGFNPDAIETYTNKDLEWDKNTFKHSTTNNQGDLVIYDSTAQKYIVRSIGTAGQVPIVKDDDSDWEWGTPSSGIFDDIKSGGKQVGWHPCLDTTTASGFLSGQITTVGTITPIEDTAIGYGLEVEGTDGADGSQLRLERN